MVTKPTELWRESIEEERRQVASGLLEEEFAVTAELFPQALLARMDDIFGRYEEEARSLREPTDETVIDTVQNVVAALNALNDEYDGDAIATSERDLLCRYIDDTLTEAGIDVDALCRRRGIPRNELTDAWRTW